MKHHSEVFKTREKREARLTELAHRGCHHFRLYADERGFVVSYVRP